MKKSLTALALIVAGAATAPAFAQDSGATNGWFVNGNVGQASVNKGPYDDSDTGYGINGGYRWAVAPSTLLGVEVGYNDLGNIKLKNAFNSDPVVAHDKSHLHGWTAGVNGHFNFTPNWYASARAGIYGWTGHGVNDNGTAPVRISADNTDWYGGVGFGYDFSNNFGVGLNYDYYKADNKGLDLSTDMWSVSAEYRF